MFLSHGPRRSGAGGPQGTDLSATNNTANFYLGARPPPWDPAARCQHHRSNSASNAPPHHPIRPRPPPIDPSLQNAACCTSVLVQSPAVMTPLPSSTPNAAPNNALRGPALQPNPHVIPSPSNSDEECASLGRVPTGNRLDQRRQSGSALGRCLERNPPTGTSPTQSTGAGNGPSRRLRCGEGTDIDGTRLRRASGTTPHAVQMAAPSPLHLPAFQTAAPSPVQPQNPYLSTFGRHYQPYPTSSLTNSEHKRLEFVMFACHHQDRTFLVLHQLWCMAVGDLPNLPREAAIVAHYSAAFRVIFNLLDLGSPISLQFAQHWANFPWPVRCLQDATLTDTFQNFERFLPRFLSAWGLLVETCQRFGRPPIVEEIEYYLAVLSPAFQRLIFEHIMQYVWPWRNLEQHDRALDLFVLNLGSRSHSSMPNRSAMAKLQLEYGKIYRSHWGTLPDSILHGSQARQSAAGDGEYACGGYLPTPPHRLASLPTNQPTQVTSTTDNTGRLSENAPAPFGLPRLNSRLTVQAPDQPPQPASINQSPVTASLPMPPGISTLNANPISRAATVGTPVSPMQHNRLANANYGNMTTQVPSDLLAVNLRPPDWAAFMTPSNQLAQLASPANVNSLNGNSQTASGSLGVGPRQNPRTKYMAQSDQPTQRNALANASLSNPNLQLPPESPMSSSLSGMGEERRKLVDLLFPRATQSAPQVSPPNPDVYALHQAHLQSPTLRLASEVAQQNASDLYQHIAGFLLPPQRMADTQIVQSATFDLADSIYSCFPKHEPAEELGSPARRFLSTLTVTCRLRCVEGCESSGLSDWLVGDCTWPRGLYFTCNGVRLHPRLKLHFGKDVPIDLTPHLRSGANQLKILSSNSKEPRPAPLTFAIETVQVMARDDIRAGCLRRKIPFAETLRSIRQTLASHNDDDVQCLSVTLSIQLTDPILATKIWTVPARSKGCRHRECFDLDTFLQTRPGKPNEPRGVDVWNCPICQADARPDVLMVDEWMAGVRRELERSDQLDAKTIVVDENGDWRVRSENERDQSNGVGGDEVKTTDVDASKTTTSSGPTASNDVVEID